MQLKKSPALSSSLRRPQVGQTRTNVRFDTGGKRSSLVRLQPVDISACCSTLSVRVSRFSTCPATHTHISEQNRPISLISRPPNIASPLRRAFYYCSGRHGALFASCLLKPIVIAPWPFQLNKISSHCVIRRGPRRDSNRKLTF